MADKIGKVYLIGAGPGDPGLITLKGSRCIKSADIVMYDRLVNPRLLENIPKNKIIYVGKIPTKKTVGQNKINALLVKLAKQGKVIARLKGGDPFLFARGAEEALFLAGHKIPFEVVPGVTSAISVPAYSGIPVSHRDYTSSVGIFAGQEQLNKESASIDWQKISCALGTLVFLMGVKNLSYIVKNLIKYGRHKNTPSCLIQQGTLPYQKSIFAKLKDIARKAKDKDIHPPAILVVGDVVSLRKKINWFESKPLFGKKILVTAPALSSIKLIQKLEDNGAWCINLPLIQVKALKDYNKLDQCVKKIKNYQGIIFTSRNAVEFFKQRLDYLKKDVRILSGIGLAVIGPGTKAALESLGLRADIEPKVYCQEGLIKSFKKEKIKGKKILVICSKDSRTLLTKELKKIGAEPDIGFAYRSVAGDRRGELRKVLQEGIDIATFTSASCARNFIKAIRKSTPSLFKKKINFASIGHVTSSELRKFGFKVDIQAEKYTQEGLAEAIIKTFK
jgi:uroporphyrinogen III methyltransferase/synthase